MDSLHDVHMNNENSFWAFKLISLEQCRRLQLLQLMDKRKGNVNMLQNFNRGTRRNKLYKLSVR